MIVAYFLYFTLAARLLRHIYIYIYTYNFLPQEPVFIIPAPGELLQDDEILKFTDVWNSRTTVRAE
jgi:hypothetical protein